MVHHQPNRTRFSPAVHPSALTDWCLKPTPFQRDPLKELAAACQEAKIKLNKPPLSSRNSYNPLN
jgi:hypothetical protein